MASQIVAIRRLCCGRNPLLRLLNKKANVQVSKQQSSTEKPNISRVNESLSPIHPTPKIVSRTDTASLVSQHRYQRQQEIDLDRLTEEYLQAINSYRFHLGLLPLELSEELTYRALNRASQLSVDNRIENTNRIQLTFNDEPIGET